jgi:hypothetical protein
LTTVQVLEHDAHKKALLRATRARFWDRTSTIEEAEATLEGAEGDITYQHPEEGQKLQRLKALCSERSNISTIHKQEKCLETKWPVLITAQPTAAITTTRRIRIRKLKETYSGADKEEHIAVESMASAAASRQGQKLNTEDITIATTTADRTTINKASTDTTSKNTMSFNNR